MWKLLCVTLSLLMCVRESLSHLEEFPFLNPRIVGGTDTTIEKWPWMVSIHYKGKHFCGGSLITDEWVLSAAHCYQRIDKSDLHVHLGRTKQEGEEANAVMMEVIDIINHKDFEKVAFGNNDIALLRLSATVKLTKYIQTVSLADETSEFAPKTESWITGWGDIGENKPLPSGTLQVAKVKVFDNKDCETACGVITDNMICAGSNKGGKGHYKGDSGGPMMSKLCSDWVQAGIISWTKECAKPNIPDVYTRVSRYQKWITDRVGITVKFVHYPQAPCPSSSLG